MHYSSIPIMALVVHLIINRQNFSKDVIEEGRTESDRNVIRTYRQFILTVLAYFAVDICWGILY
ncbi:MAG: hypothetical protein K6A92_09095, partial [Lachnospiraceae bacterium]|nr:hypothetical protein [Lachnospiraceae bacterium]